MPVVPPSYQTRSGQADTVRPRQFVAGESSCRHTCCGESWDVDRFLRNGGRLFYGSTDAEESHIWLDTARSVLEHLGCPLDLRVRIATGAMQKDSRVWWEAVQHSSFLRCPVEQITWEQFWDTFYEQYFADTVRAAKKVEFLMLRQTEDMSMAQYQARFLRLERFALCSLTSERERAAQFVSGLHISIRSVVATFSCATLAEAVMRALQNEHAHVSYQQERAMAQMVQASHVRSQGWHQQQDYEPQ